MLNVAVSIVHVRPSLLPFCLCPIPIPLPPPAVSASRCVVLLPFLRAVAIIRTPHLLICSSYASDVCSSTSHEAHIVDVPERRATEIVRPIRFLVPLLPCLLPFPFPGFPPPAVPSHGGHNSWVSCALVPSHSYMGWWLTSMRLSDVSNPPATGIGSSLPLLATTLYPSTVCRRRSVISCVPAPRQHEEGLACHTVGMCRRL